MGLPQAGPLNSLLLSFLHDPALPIAIPAARVVRRAFLRSGARLHPAVRCCRYGGASVWQGRIRALGGTPFSLVPPARRMAASPASYRYGNDSGRFRDLAGRVGAGQSGRTTFSLGPPARRRARVER